MRILVGGDEGLALVRWLEGEKTGTVVERAFEGDVVHALARGPDALLAAVAGRGLCRSIDGGLTWSPLAAQPGEGRPTALSVAPSGTVVVGTEPPALHLSRDAGGSWTTLERFAALGASEDWSSYGDRPAHVEAIALDPHDSSRLYAGVEIGGAYRSDDAGTSWVGVNDGLYDDVHGILVDPRDGSRVFAATGGGLYVSHDRGADWRPVAGDVGERYCTSLHGVSSTPATPPGESLFLVATAAGPPSAWGRRGAKADARLWASRDSGRTWAVVEEQGIRGSSPATAFTSDPRTRSAILAGTASGHLVHADLVENRWRQILYGLGGIRSLLIL